MQSQHAGDEAAAATALNMTLLGQVRGLKKRLAKFEAARLAIAEQKHRPPVFAEEAVVFEDNSEDQSPRSDRFKVGGGQLEREAAERKVARLLRDRIDKRRATDGGKGHAEDREGRRNTEDDELGLENKMGENELVNAEIKDGHSVWAARHPPNPLSSTASMRQLVKGT